MTGQELYEATTSLLNGYAMDETQFYLFLNVARVYRELVRPWKRLEKLDQSQIASAVNLPTLVNQNPKTLPADFHYLKEDGFLTLYNNNQQWQQYYEIPQNLAVQYLQVNNRFYIDHANMQYYLCGIVDQPYNILMYYQADYGDITATTTWVNINSRYHMILAFDVASMYRLGVSYDDVNARNAENNNRQAELLFDAMKKWDDNLARSSVTMLDYPTVADREDANFNHRIQM